MTDHPIIFSADMVRALLDGRKTMTRRLLYSDRVAKNGITPASTTFLENHKPPVPEFTHYWVLTPWHKVKAGDRLYVRECFSYHKHDSGIWCWADGNIADEDCERPIRPSIHMPRRLSRLTLIVTATKIERVQEISLQDVWAEGCEVRHMWLFGADGPERQRIGANVFGNLWSDLHGRESWNANPEVVAMTFRVIRANIDSPEAKAA